MSGEGGALAHVLAGCTPALQVGAKGTPRGCLDFWLKIWAGGSGGYRGGGGGAQAAGAPGKGGGGEGSVCPVKSAFSEAAKRPYQAPAGSQGLGFREEMGAGDTDCGVRSLALSTW